MKRFGKTIMTGVCLIGFSLSAVGQNCADMYKKANTLKNSGKYKDAIVFYQKAMSCDDNLRTDCNKWIKYCREHIKEPAATVLELSTQTVRIPYQGGDERINVKSSSKWTIEGSSDWCVTDAYNSKNFIVKCRTANNSTREKMTEMKVKSGSLFRTVRVIQEARPEFLAVGANALSFPANGTEDVVSVKSNAEWDVTSAPKWCKVEKKDDGIHIIVTPNDRVIERTDEIVIVSPSKSVTIRVRQGAGEEHLALSQNNLVMDSEGDVHYMKVYTDADNWFVGDYPTWMNVQRVGKDSIRIECGKNLPNGEPRSGSLQVKTDRQTAGIMVTQSPRMAQDLIFPNSSLVGGRNFSLGFSASYYAPFVSTSAGGDYVGSVVDYGLGTSQENASYKSATGFSFGVFADMRLYKNIFLIGGLNFAYVQYKNTFNKNTTYTIPLVNLYERGTVANSYTEEYTHTMLEVPILASYRFKLTDMSHLQLNLGPVLNFGLSAKMKLSGNTDSETMHMYNGNGSLYNNDNYVVHNAVYADFDLYKSKMQWNELLTTGNDHTVTHPEEFKASPLNKFNCGLRVGVAYEWAGLSVGLSYTHMLTNMANKNYWENERLTVLNQSDKTMKGVKYRINTLEVKLAYTLRYLKLKK